MKKILGMLAMALCLIGCSKGPDKVAVALYEALSDGNADKAAEYATKNSQPFIKMATPIFAEKYKGGKFKAVETKIDGKKATVKIESKSKDGKTVVSEDVHLVKEDGDWKVAVDKDNMN